MQEKCQSLKLSGLGETDLLDLLNMHAFSGVNPDDYRNLQQISKKMVGKLSGSPLAAKVLGGLLNSKRDSSTWNRMLTSSIYNIEQGKEVWGYDPGYPQQTTWVTPPGVVQPTRRSLVEHGVARRTPQDTGKIS